MSIKRALTDILSLFIILTPLAFFSFSTSNLTDESIVEAGAIRISACLILAFILAYALFRRRFRTLGIVLFGSSQDIYQFKLQILWCWQLSLTFLSLLLLSASATQVSFSELLDENGFAGAVRLFQGIFHPNFKILPTAIINIVETTFVAFLATCLAIPVAFVLSFASAKNVMSSPRSMPIYFLLRTFFNVIRSIEPFIWAIIFSVWVGIGSFAGMLALMIHSIASLVKQYSEIIESVSSGPIEGIEATGATRLQVLWFGIVPQVVLPFISFTIYRWDINVRMATVIGLVGGGGIGTMLIKYQGLAMWPEVGCIIFVIALTVWALDNASAYFREAIK